MSNSLHNTKHEESHDTHATEAHVHGGHGHHDEMHPFKNDPSRITYIGNVDYRNKMVKFGIKAKDRTRHTYIIGKTGMGKSTLLENLAIQDIQNGEGVAFLDPHGGTAEKLLDFVPAHRKKDVIYFAPFDTEYPLALNVLEKVDKDKRHLVANGLMAAFKKLFKDQFSARMEYILNNIVLALLENDGETLLGVNRMLTDKVYRDTMVANVTDPSVKAFWLEEYAKYTDKFAAEAAPAIQNKVGQFVANPLIRNIIGQKKTSFDLRDVMDNRKILIINLSKGKMGEGNANLIGSLLITKIYLAAMSRADVDVYKQGDLAPLYFYVDEFQNFANESFAQILSEARKYQLALTVAHQYIEQMTDEVRAAIFGNVGTMITYRVGATDAEVFEKEFAPVFMADDIVNLSAYQMYLRLMIDGVGSKPFSAQALPPIQEPEKSFAKEMIEYSRSEYGKRSEIVEEEVATWYADFKVKKVENKKVANQTVAKIENKAEVKTDKVELIKKEIKKEEASQEPHLSREYIAWKEKQEQEKNKKEEDGDDNVLNVDKKNIKQDDVSENKTDQQNKRQRSRKGNTSQAVAHNMRDLDMTQVRTDHHERKVEAKEANNSLKEALARAMSQTKVESTQRAGLSTKDTKKREENIGEVDEKTLRELVG